ncbi:helix-turn-helix domain-containing protein [Paenibacillus mendelii]|uniref:Helix-turn-helix domain-containing protein n=1 Tax=Paenibacillus mendelii TaxID=206163 RepID=A0ABV6J9E5_9BACL|nr:AraC family transcriptional regulator [Paenibacillus mendelii]MCQ6559831.1 AraC family transcriptional regulator [Paenibacillus mendelii]
MNPLRKHFEANSPFPFAFVYKDTKSSQSELPDHLHDWYELVFVYGGKGTFFIDQTFYEMEPGNLFLIPGNTIHRAFPDSVNPITSSALFFSPILLQNTYLGDAFSLIGCFDHAKRSKTYKIGTPLSERGTLTTSIDTIHREMEEARPGYRHAVLLHVQHILLQITRSVAPDQETRLTESTIGPRWMQHLLADMDNQLESNLSLASLSRHANVTPAHFSRVFKQLTGMNVTEYVTTKRIIRAKELLIESDDSIAIVAERCGFESLPHFHRMFKKIAGLTPAAYKKGVKPK